MGDAVSITVLLKPGAGKNSVALRDDGAVAVSVTSRPHQGEANSHLIRLLAKTLRVPQSSCEIIQGMQSRRKAVTIDGLDREDIVNRLAKAGRESGGR